MDFSLAIATAFSAILVTVSIYVHYRALRALARIYLVNLDGHKKPLLKVLFSLFLVHLIEVQLFAFAMVLMDKMGLGHLGGATAGEASLVLDYFYFSMASYTTLGLGDIVPHGLVRLVAAIEALCGLMLIAWSASFAYLMMEQIWRASHIASGDVDD